jgi:hypothetical protein
LPCSGQERRSRAVGRKEEKEEKDDKEEEEEEEGWGWMDGVGDAGKIDLFFGRGAIGIGFNSSHVRKLFALFLFSGLGFRV